MRKCLLWIAPFLFSASLFAQTSWIGAVSTNWSSGGNWTAGAPTATIDAIIGDASFTGAFQPTLTANSACKSLTLGSGSIISVLTIAALATLKIGGRTHKRNTNIIYLPDLLRNSKYHLIIK